MRYSNEEYEKLIIDLNLNKNKKIIWIGAFLCLVIVFIVMTVFYKDISLAIPVSVFSFVGGYFLCRKLIYDNAKKANYIRDIKYVEQEIYEDKLVEKVVRTGEQENIGEYFYKDIVLVKEDKKNFYLYLNMNCENFLV